MFESGYKHFQTLFLMPRLIAYSYFAYCDIAISFKIMFYWYVRKRFFVRLKNNIFIHDLDSKFKAWWVG